jgi:hypothetical protein
MSVRCLAAYCSCSPRQIYLLRKKFPKEAPPLSDEASWKTFVNARRTVVAEKRQHPKQASRSDADTQSDHAKYIHFRALRTAALAESEQIRLAITKREMISRIEVETAFLTVANRVKARLRRLVNDAPSALLGLSEYRIHEVLGEQIQKVLNEIALDKDFYKPRRNA